MYYLIFVLIYDKFQLQNLYTIVVYVVGPGVGPSPLPMRMPYTH